VLPRTIAPLYQPSSAKRTEPLLAAWAWKNEVKLRSVEMFTE